MQNKKHILLVAPYLTFPNEPGANRFITLTNMLSQEYEVTLITSRFCHFLKSQRTDAYPLKNVELVLLDEPGYTNNVSISRLTSHRVFCNNLIKYMESNTKPIDLVYSAYPLIYTNYYLGKNKHKFGYKLVIDVQDVWPDAIMGPISLFSNPLGKLTLAPVNKYANVTYGYADGLIAVSETYLKKADVNQLPQDKKASVFIGSERLFFDPNHHPSQAPDKPIVATYIGTMAGSYDLDTIVRAAPLVKDKVHIQFIGTGQDESGLQALNKTLGGHVRFLGTMKYNDAMQILSQSDIAINPIKTHAQQSITNKLSDYFCCGLPILSCQENDEVKKLLSQGGGMQYVSQNPSDLAQKLLYLGAHRDNLSNMSEVNKNIAKSKFLRERSYIQIVDVVARVLSK